MAGFIRRYTFDPGQTVLTEIEGVVVIDREPPGSVEGASTGVAVCIGEFEDGPFSVDDGPVEVLGSDDYLRTFGGFGFVYDGIPSQNPCARSRLADAAVQPEYWNGNGFIGTVNKKFSRLIIARVDTTVGEVEFTRLANVIGLEAFTYALTSGNTLTLLLDNADGLLSPARITSAAGTYPTGFTGGETITIDVDGAGPTLVTFLVGDQTQAQVISRINTALGATIASSISATVSRLTSTTLGPSSSLEITAVSGAAVTTATGFSVTAVTNGTNNSDVATFTGTVATLASAAGTYPTTFTGGESLNLTIDEGTSKQIGPLDVYFLASDQLQADVVNRINAAVGYTAASAAGGGVTNTIGRVGGTDGVVTINSVSSALVTTATGYAASDTASGTGNVGDISQVTFEEIKTIVEAAVTNSFVDRNADGELRVASTTTTSDAYIEVIAQTATALGFTVGDHNDIGDGEAGTIAAGTRITDGTTTWVTAQTLSVEEGEPGPYAARVRPALDDGTALGAGVSTVDTLSAPIALDAFSVTNNLPIAAALSEAAIDAAYVAALDSTLNANAVSREGDLVFSARSSNAIRVAGRQNALRASAEGLAGRKFLLRPPLGTTTRAQARSNTSQPGVGAYREQRVFYCYPGAATFVPQIAVLGVAGGAGFTADGIIDTGFDAWVASLCSQLPPEENPGQQTSFMGSIISVERGNPDVQDMRIEDYKAFKRAGIAALRIENGVAIVQSGKTSVDPSSFPNLQNINRRRMADFIQDSLARRSNAFSKQLATKVRRAAVLGETDAFLSGLLSENNPSSQRIDSYSIDAKSPNTPQTLAAGLFRIRSKVRTLASLDVIVHDTEIGEGVVTVTEVP